MVDSEPEPTERPRAEGCDKDSRSHGRDHTANLQPRCVRSGKGLKLNNELDDASVSRWIPGIATGDEEAVQFVVDRYYDDLVRVARRKLAGMPAQVADDEGAVVSALRSFVSAVQAQRFPDLTNRVNLWKLLVTLTVRKSVAQLRKHWKQRGEGDKVVRAADIEALVAKDPGPEHAASFMEQCESYLHALGDETLRRIAVLSMQGWETDEIAAELNIHRRSVQRKLALIRAEWQEKIEA